MSEAVFSPVRIGRPSIGAPSASWHSALAGNLILAGHAAFRYSWRMPHLGQGGGGAQQRNKGATSCGGQACGGIHPA